MNREKGTIHNFILLYPKSTENNLIYSRLRYTVFSARFLHPLLRFYPRKRFLFSFSSSIICCTSDFSQPSSILCSSSTFIVASATLSRLNHHFSTTSLQPRRFSAASVAPSCIFFYSIILFLLFLLFPLFDFPFLLFRFFSLFPFFLSTSLPPSTTSISQPPFRPSKVNRLHRYVQRLAFARKVYRDYRLLKPRPAAPTKSIKGPHLTSNQPQNRSIRSNRPSKPYSRRRLLSMRLYDFARQTRDTYLPKIQSRVQLFVGEDYYAAAPKVPPDAQLSVFPLYTTQSDDGIYHVSVKALLSTPGTMSRKNRLILSLARQVTRGLEAAVDQLAASSARPETTRSPLAHDDALVNSGNSGNSPNSPRSLNSSPNSPVEHVDPTQDGADANDPTPDVISPADSSADAQSFASSSPSLAEQHNTTLRERLAGFLARSCPNAVLIVTVGAEDPNVTDLVTKELTTDSLGVLRGSLEVPYRPLAVQVVAKDDETVCCVREVMLLPDGGVGLISDIDDTVKLTGVTGDKRELMRLLLLYNVLTWYIKPVVQWYIGLAKRHPLISFHYVSNSPWQLFPLILEYFGFAKLPPGSVHLKNYTGNLIALLMEPLQLRKKASLDGIYKDFPKKAFVCVGDSGEWDLEAYVSVSNEFPGQTLAICIRVVPGTLSDQNDDPILREARLIVRHYEAKKAGFAKGNARHGNSTAHIVDSAISRFQSTAKRGRSASPEVTSDLIDLDGKVPPPIPTKPAFLRSEPLRKPPLPERPVTDAPAFPERPRERLSSPVEHHFDPPARSQTMPALDDLHPDFVHLLPRQKRLTTSDLVIRSLQNIYSAETLYELEQIDKKGSLWLTRVAEALEILKDTPTRIVFFKDDDTALLEECSAFIESSFQK